MIIKKDKETIENLKKQISEYQYLLKQKEIENKNNKISFGKKSGIANNNNKRFDEIKFDVSKKFKQEKRNHSTENIKISKYNKNDENIFNQTQNLNNFILKNNDKEQSINKEKFYINEMSEQYNNLSETYFNNFNDNEIKKENDIKEDFCNYNYKGIKSNNENDEEFVFNIENRQLNFDQMKNEDIK